MSAAPVSCTKCNAPLAGDIFNRGEQFVPCPSCRAPLQIEIFPAMFRQIATGQSGEAVMEEVEASCFYHPEKKAVLPCDSCGRFICALCDCELQGQHLCPTCLESGRKKGKIKSLENRRILYDDMALGMSILGFLPSLTCLGWITAPAIIFFSIRHWNSPLSLLPRTKIRYVLACLIAIGILAFQFFILYVKFAARSHITNPN